MTRAPHLVLIGLMGAGKTTVGRRCAASLDRGFVDTDELVETQAGQSVPELFASAGEQGFRDAERAAVADAVASPEALVIACGGGAMGLPENRRAVRDEVVIWLTADPEELASRVTRQSEIERPLLVGADAGATMRRLGAVRAVAYGDAADAVVATDDRDIEAVVTEVLDAYAEIQA